MQTTTAGSRDPQRSGSSLAPSDSNSNNNDDADSKRRKATQACDYCRQKRTKCDNAKPRCHQCAKTGILCTFFTRSKKRGPIPREELDPEARQAAIDHASGRQIVKPKPTRNIGPLQLTHYGNLRPRFNTLRNFYPLHLSYFGNLSQSDDPMRRLIEEGHNPSIEASSARPTSARGDLWRKEVTDHLVEVFFEHCFQDFDNFDPKEFLKDYTERKINPSLLNAICAVAARFSDHPDVVQAPPYLSGEPYAEKTREKIMDLIDEATISNLHALFILSFYEHSAWSGPRGWRFGGLASRMGIELYLHNQRDVPTLEADRVKFEAKCRTFWNLIHIDIFSAASVGLPSILDVKLYNIQLPDYRPDWWVERHQELEAAIIGEVEEDSDIQETISTQPETTPKDPFASRILTKLQETRRLRGHGPAKYLFEPIELLFRVSHYINGNTLESDKCPSDPSSEFTVLEGRLSTCIKTIGEEVPLTPKALVESEENVAYIILTYYMTVIMLHRPIVALENVVDTSFVDQSRVRCAEAATKITEIIEQFNEIDIKYRGHLFVFQVFTGAAIHVTNIFSSDVALAANAKRCLNVHLNFLKVSSPHWTGSTRLYVILQDLYSAQVTANAKSDSSTVTSPTATPQDRSGSESRSDRASSSGAGHSPISVSLQSVRIDHTSDHQDGSGANTALTREWLLMIPPGSTTSSIINSTSSGDSRSDGASVRHPSGIGLDQDEAGQGELTTSAGTTTKRPSKKVKEMPPLSRPIFPRPPILGTSTTQPAPEESMAMADSASGLATSAIAPHLGAPSPTITSTTIMVPPEPFSQPRPQPPFQPLPLQVSAQNSRHQPLPIPISLHSLNTPPHLLSNLEFIDSHSLERLMSTLPPPYRRPHSHSRGHEHESLQTVYQWNVSSAQTAIPISNGSPSSSSFNLYEQDRTTASTATFAPQPPPPLASRRVSMPFNPISGHSGEPTYAPAPPHLPPHWSIEIVDSYPSVFGTHSRTPPSVSLPPPSLHSHPGLLPSSSSSSGAAGGREGFFSAGIPINNEWTIDQDIMFGSRTAPWPTDIVHERVGAREGMIEYQHLHDKQQEYMSTQFMRKLPVVDLGTIHPSLTTLALNPPLGGYGSSASGGGGSSTVGMHSFVETSSSAGLAPFVQQQQQLEQQATHLQYPAHGSVMQPSMHGLFQFQAPQEHQQY